MIATEPELTLSNARVVLPDRVIENGTLVVRGGIIAEIGEGTARGSIDCDGDLVIPGLVELHTDNLETQFRPRPKVTWPVAAALQSHDVLMAGCGITTVLDAVRIGTNRDEGGVANELTSLAQAVCEARRAGVLRADHFIHLRCELACEDTVSRLSEIVTEPEVRLVSLMDHTPGQRQFVSMDAFRTYYLGKTGMTDAELDLFIADRLEAHHRLAAPTRRSVVAIAAANGVALASHDDATAEHVAEAIADGVAIAEFPTTEASARAAHDAGLAVLMGAPNLVRGRSHSGNVAAEALARAGTLDVLSSDYVPYSLLQSALTLPARVGDISLAAAIRLVTQAPARAVGLTDRGALREGLRADLVRVADSGPAPVVRGVWREGERIA